MTDFNLQEIQLVERLRDNYETLNKAKVTFVDKRIRYLIARLFMKEEAELDIEKFMAMSQYLKEETGVFTTLTTNIRASLAGLLVASGEESPIAAQRLVSFYKQLIDAKFQRTEYTYFAAYLLLENKEGTRAVISKAREIYLELKADHPFLTGAEDITSSVMLAQMDTDMTVHEIAEITEYYYQAFADLKLRKSNGLQFLAATGTLLYGEKQKAYIEQVKKVLAILDKERIKITELHYSGVGIMAFALGEQKLDGKFLAKLIEELKKLPVLRFDRKFQTAIAISLYIENEIGHMDQQQVEGLMISMNLLIAIEQAALASVAAASTVAASSGGN